MPSIDLQLTLQPCSLETQSLSGPKSFPRRASLPKNGMRESGARVADYRVLHIAGLSAPRLGSASREDEVCQPLDLEIVS
jgi:hypothetical protein